MNSRDELLYLDMSDNFLKSILPIISSINLQGLPLRNTTITFIRATIVKLRKLEFVDLSNNKLSYIPPNILDRPNLETIDIGNNLFSSDHIQSIQKIFHKSRSETKLIV